MDRHSIGQWTSHLAGMHDSPAVVAQLTLQLIFSCTCAVPSSKYTPIRVVRAMSPCALLFGSSLLRCLGVKICVVTYDCYTHLRLLAAHALTGARSLGCTQTVSGVHPNRVSPLLSKCIAHILEGSSAVVTRAIMRRKPCLH